jgi:glycosyltransferase involved in cell wall biosynthesis
MEEKLNLSVILPIKSAVVKDFDEFFDKAIKSLKLQKIAFNELLIVHTSEEQLVNKLQSYDFESLNVKLIEYKEEPNYQSQVNLGIKNVSSEWVSFFEFDDEYSSIWFNNVKKYSSLYSDVEAFLPIVVDVDSKDVFAGFTNEATFAANFTQEMGYLNNDTLLDYQNFQTAGMVVKKSALDNFGGFKPSMKLTFVYEFLLRLTYNSVRIMTIPKIGYKHMSMREGSIFWSYKNGESVISNDEVKFWISTAKKEYFFSNDRNIKYEGQSA